MLSTKDKIKLVDDLLKADGESCIRDYLNELRDLEQEIELIERSTKKNYGKKNIHFNDKIFK